MKSYKTVILGSGHYSVGCALTAEDAVIVERTYMADPIHSATLSGYLLGEGVPSGDEAKRLFDIYSNSGAVKDGRLDSPVLEIGLSAFAKERGVRFLFGSECIAAEKSDCGYILTLFGNAGVMKIAAERVIDRREGSRRVLNILVRAERAWAEGLLPDFADVTVTDAFHEGELVLGFGFRKITDINEAKSKVIDYLDSLGGEKIKIVDMPYLAASEAALRADVFSELEAGIAEGGCGESNISLSFPFEENADGEELTLSYLDEGKLVCENVRGTVFEHKTEVLVIGLGAAGINAAIASAREGARTFAIERDAGIGGMPINGGVVFFYYGERGGTYEEMERRARAIERRLFFATGSQIETRRAVLHRELCERGVGYLSGVSVIGVYSREGRIVGVKVYDGGVIRNIASDMLIDATSDGHVVRACPGVVTELGRVSDGKTVPFTNRTRALTSDGKLSHYNGDDGYCNQYDPESFSEQVLAAHATKLELIKNMKRSGARVLAVSSTPGVREGLRYIGEERLTYLDIISGKEPERILFYARSDLDKHGHDHAMDDEEYRNWWVISNLATVTVRIPVPIGAVVPKGLLGIASAGRCISVDSYASSAVRMNTDMFRMGECVGIAAAMAVKDGVAITEIDYGKYCETADGYGVRLGRCADKFAFDHPSKKDFYKKVTFDLTDSEIIDALSTNTPGVAIWSAHIAERDLTPLLSSYLCSENETLRFNSAVALGIRGCDKCLPVLRSAVKCRNLERYADCRRSNQYKSAIAICLIGSLGDKSDRELLLPILEESEISLPIYSQINAVGEEGDIARDGYYQILTHAIAALISIARRHGGKEQLAAELDGLLDAERRRRIVDTVSFGRPEGSLGVEVRDFLKNSRELL